MSGAPPVPPRDAGGGRPPPPPAWVTDTQASLRLLISYPPVTTPLLEKPPFAYVHDLLANARKRCTLFDDEDNGIEEKWWNIHALQAKSARLHFISRVVRVVESRLGHSLGVSARALVESRECERTCALLRGVATLGLQCARVAPLARRPQRTSVFNFGIPDTPPSAAMPVIMTPLDTPNTAARSDDAHTTDDDEELIDYRSGSRGATASSSRTASPVSAALVAAAAATAALARRASSQKEAASASSSVAAAAAAPVPRLEPMGRPPRRPPVTPLIGARLAKGAPALGLPPRPIRRVSRYDLIDEDSEGSDASPLDQASVAPSTMTIPAAASSTFNSAAAASSVSPHAASPVQPADPPDDVVAESRRLLRIFLPSATVPLARVRTMPFDLLLALLRSAFDQTGFGAGLMPARDPRANSDADTLDSPRRLALIRGITRYTGLALGRRLFVDAERVLDMSAKRSDAHRLAQGVARAALDPDLHMPTLLRRYFDNEEPPTHPDDQPPTGDDGDDKDDDAPPPGTDLPLADAPLPISPPSPPSPLLLPTTTTTATNTPPHPPLPPPAPIIPPYILASQQSLLALSVESDPTPILSESDLRRLTCDEFRRLVHFVIERTGFLAGLFTPEQLAEDGHALSDPIARHAFLERLLRFVCVALPPHAQLRLTAEDVLAAEQLPTADSDDDAHPQLIAYAVDSNDALQQIVGLAVDPTVDLAHLLRRFADTYPSELTVAQQRLAQPPPHPSPRSPATAAPPPPMSSFVAASARPHSPARGATASHDDDELAIGAFGPDDIFAAPQPWESTLNVARLSRAQRERGAREFGASDPAVERRTHALHELVRDEDTSAFMNHAGLGATSDDIPGAGDLEGDSYDEAAALPGFSTAAAPADSSWIITSGTHVARPATASVDQARDDRTDAQMLAPRPPPRHSRSPLPSSSNRAVMKGDALSPFALSPSSQPQRTKSPPSLLSPPPLPSPRPPVDDAVSSSSPSFILPRRRLEQHAEFVRSSSERATDPPAPLDALESQLKKDGVQMSDHVRLALVAHKTQFTARPLILAKNYSWHYTFSVLVGVAMILTVIFWKIFPPS